VTLNVTRFELNRGTTIKEEGCRVPLGKPGRGGLLVPEITHFPKGKKHPGLVTGGSDNDTARVKQGRRFGSSVIPDGRLTVL